MPRWNRTRWVKLIPDWVVPPALPGALLAFPPGGGELVQVGGGQLAEPAAGLDQQPGRDLGRVRSRDPVAEPGLGRGVQDAGEVLVQAQVPSSSRQRLEILRSSR